MENTKVMIEPKSKFDWKVNQKFMRVFFGVFKDSKGRSYLRQMSIKETRSWLRKIMDEELDKRAQIEMFR